MEELESSSASHPLDGCDAEDCYKIMMAERTELIKARREVEDNLVKTVIQLSAALIALTAGFIAQTNVDISPSYLPYVTASIASFALALVLGLGEQLCSSRAYLAQQELVEKFYTRQISEFSEPSANKWVRGFQVSSFVVFVVALLLLGYFAVMQAGEKNVRRSSTASAPAATSSSAATSAATSIGRDGKLSRGSIIPLGNEVSSADNAAATSEKAGLISARQKLRSLPSGS